jgi:hypothetical protein
MNVTLENTNRIFLDDSNFAVDEFTVTATVVDESGLIVKDKNANDLKNVSARFIADKTRYAIDLSFDPNTKTGSLRIFWVAIKDGLSLDVDEQYTPQDIQLVATSTLTEMGSEILSITDFLDSYLAAEASLDDNFIDAINVYAQRNRKKLRSQILAAQGDIQRDIKIHFFPTKSKMDRDYNQQNFWSEFWMQQTDWRPVISVDSYKLVYGNNSSDLSQNLKDQMVVNKEMGTIEFLPTIFSGNLFTILVSNVNAVAATIIAGSSYDRIPMLFRIEYTDGLDFANLPAPEKESIRNAVGRRALINLLPKVDPSLRNQSESLSLDGASHSASSGMTKVIEGYIEEEKKWTKSIMKQYGTHVDFAVA